MTSKNLIETAQEIALNAHRAQVDNGGEPYIEHVKRVAAKMDTPTERAVAILHDVLEDSDYTPKDLEDHMIPGNIIAAVITLTKRDGVGETYEEYIKQLAINRLARKVKMADLEDNMNLLRLPELTSTDWKRAKKYHAAWHYLNDSPN